MQQNRHNEECARCPENSKCNALYQGKLCTILRRKHGLDRPMTNSEAIRAMSDQAWVESGPFPCPYDLDGQGCKFAEEERTQTCEECKLEWLSLIG